MDSYNRGGHSKYSLKVHIIFVTKYRKNIFLNNIGNTKYFGLMDILLVV